MRADLEPDRVVLSRASAGRVEEPAVEIHFLLQRELESHFLVVELDRLRMFPGEELPCRVDPPCRQVGPVADLSGSCLEDGEAKLGGGEGNLDRALLVEADEAKESDREVEELDDREGESRGDGVGAAEDASQLQVLGGDLEALVRRDLLDALLQVLEARALHPRLVARGLASLGPVHQPLRAPATSSHRMQHRRNRFHGGYAPSAPNLIARWHAKVVEAPLLCAAHGRCVAVLLSTCRVAMRISRSAIPQPLFVELYSCSRIPPLVLHVSPLSLRLSSLALNSVLSESCSSLGCLFKCHVMPCGYCSLDHFAHNFILHFPPSYASNSPLFWQVSQESCLLLDRNPSSRIFLIHIDFTLISPKIRPTQHSRCISSSLLQSTILPSYSSCVVTSACSLLPL
eukprot:749729-Hanusia_phi.AAC.1